MALKGKIITRGGKVITRGNKIVTGCGATTLPPCTGVPLACPSGMAGSYTISMPSSVTWGSCTPPPVCGGGTPVTSVSVSGSCAGSWSVSPSAKCVAGKQLALVSLSNSLNGPASPILSCPAWLVTVIFGRVGLTNPRVTYYKLRTGATINDIVGTYFLLKIDQDFNGPICAGATADATITVSP